jgi:hypothetical protein
VGRKPPPPVAISSIHTPARLGQGAVSSGRLVRPGKLHMHAFVDGILRLAGNAFCCRKNSQFCSNASTPRRRGFCSLSSFRLMLAIERRAQGIPASQIVPRRASNVERRASRPEARQRAVYSASSITEPWGGIRMLLRGPFGIAPRPGSQRCGLPHTTCTLRHPSQSPHRRSSSI